MDVFYSIQACNLAPRLAGSFDLSRYACCSNIILAPPRILIIIRWAKNIQCMGRSTLLPIPAVKSHMADLAAAYQELLAALPTTSPNQMLLTLMEGSTRITATVFMLVKAFKIMIHALGLDQTLYTLHSLRRGGAISAYRATSDLLEVKQAGMWTINAFWAYITSPCTSTSPVASALATATLDTLY